MGSTYKKYKIYIVLPLNFIYNCAFYALRIFVIKQAYITGYYFRCVTEKKFKVNFKRENQLV